MNKFPFSRKTGLALAGLVLAAGLAAIFLRGGVPVLATQAVRTDIAPTLFGIGVVEARRSILVGPTAAGRVARVLVEQGERVEVGQLLAEMDPVDLDDRLTASRHALTRAKSGQLATQAQAQEAESRLDTAAASAQRYTALRERGFVSAEAERVKGHEARAAEAGLRASRANLDAAGADAARLAAEAGALEKQRANSRLRAPVDGFVVARDLEAGSTAVAGQAVLRLVETGSIWLRVRIDQGRSAGLAVGLPASIALRSRPGETFAGKLVRIEQLSDAVTEERVAMVAFEALPPGLTLNEMAEVTLQLPLRAQVLVVPPAGLVRQGGKSGVFVIDDGRARFRAVKVGARTETGVEILDGIAEGDWVITQTTKPLTETDRVRVSSNGGDIK